MFPTAGYFRNVPCPFFVHGLCHRPYCHFRHAKPDTKGKRDTSSEWTYGEVIDNEDAEARTSKGEEDLMRIIKNLSPGKRKHGEPAKKKSVSFPQFQSDQSDDTEKVVVYTPTAINKSSREKESHKRKTASGESDNDPIPQRVVKEISELLQITSATDESAKIAEEVKNRKKSKKGNEDEKNEEEEDGDINTEKDEDVEEKNIFEVIEDIPKMPPKLTDINFFSVEKDGVPIKSKKKKNVKERKEKSIHEVSEGSSSDCFDNSEATLKEIFDSYDPGQLGDSELPSTINNERQNDGPDKEEGRLDAIKETVGAGSIKRRIAHNPSIEAVRQPLSKKGITVRGPVKPSFVSPSIASAKIQTNKKASINKDVEKVDQRSSFTTPDGIYIGKKRKAHVIEPMQGAKEAKGISGSTISTKVESPNPAKRPKIPVEFGSKVPHNIRQKYLDRIIDEYTPKLQSLQEVYDKAAEEEQQIFNRCSRRQIYMSLCANAIKRIRELPGKEDETASISDAKKQSIKPLTDSYAKIAAQLAGSVTPSKTIIRPSSISLAKTDKKHSSLLGGGQDKGNRRSSITDVSDLTEDVFYEHLLKYLMTDQEKWDNNYPKESADNPGVAVYKERKGSPDFKKQNCARCGKPFQLNADEEYVTRVECHYHWGKLRRMKGRGGVVTQFSCCQADSGGPGCSVAKLHVADYMGDLDGYAATRTHTKKNTRKVYSLDCEMCYTAHGLELTRVTVVDFNMSQILDAFVKPNRQIIDYNTRFSGVTEEDLKDVEIKLNDVHRKLLKKFGTDTILIGHSLESDLRALKLIHNKIVDTALVFPHRLGLPYKRALRTLMGEFLQKIIQDSEGGHDSYEDAAACMQLMKWKIVEDLKKEARKTGLNVR